MYFSNNFVYLFILITSQIYSLSFLTLYNKPFLFLLLPTARHQQQSYHIQNQYKSLQQYPRFFYHFPCLKIFALLFFFLVLSIPTNNLQFTTKNCNIRMMLGRLPMMDFKQAYDVELMCSTSKIRHELWPLDEIDSKNGKFPCCLVWTPLPVVSWLAPFIGHLGICREDGVILDFSGSNFVNVDEFAFGATARYVQLDREKCCFPLNMSSHTCKQGYQHSEYGTAVTWDDALQSSVRHFEHKSYNLFTCNSHSFVANCLNRLCYGGSMDWNMLTVAALILFKGHWVDTMSIIRSFLPSTVVLCLGLGLVGWPFLVGLFSFSLLLMGWFLLGTYCLKTLMEI